MTIQDLKQLIDKLPEDTPVGFTDHFGSFINLDPDQITIDNIDINAVLRLVVIIIPPYIGDEPD